MSSIARIEQLKEHFVQIFAHIPLKGHKQLLSFYTIHTNIVKNISN